MPALHISEIQAGEHKVRLYSWATQRVAPTEKIFIWILRIKGKFTNIFKVMVRISVYPRGATRTCRTKEKLP